MKNISHSMVTAGTVLMASALVARADDIHNFYVTADAGAIFQQDANFSENGGRNVQAGFNPGARIDLAVGYNVNENLSLEIEPGFMWNSVDTLAGHSLGQFGESIDLDSVPVIVNLLYRFPTGTDWTPYVGAGIGANVTIFDGKLPNATASDTSAAFAFQGEAGVRYALTDHASVSLDYKFLGTTDQDYAFNVGHFTDRVKFNGNYIHGVFIDFHWSF